MLRVEYLEAPPVAPMSFEIKDGQCLAIEGPSGSGKTRLMRAIADLDPAHGNIFLDGAERSEIPAPKWRCLVRYVSAEPAWWTPTARPLLVASTQQVNGDAQNSEKLGRTLSALGLEPTIVDQPISTLSTGQRQRLALLRALTDDPRVILFDEPTAALDPTAAALVEELIRYQTLAGRMIILSSHDEKLRKSLADQTITIASHNTTSDRAPQDAGGTP